MKERQTRGAADGSAAGDPGGHGKRGEPAFLFRVYAEKKGQVAFEMGDRAGLTILFPKHSALIARMTKG